MYCWPLGKHALQTAPPQERTEEDGLLRKPAKAVLLFSSAAHLVKPVSSLRSTALLGVGRGLRCAAADRGDAEEMSLVDRVLQRKGVETSVETSVPLDFSTVPTDANDPCDGIQVV